MNSTAEQLRAELDALRKRYIALCDVVDMKAGRAYGHAGNGDAAAAADVCAELMQTVTSAKHQCLMQQESSRNNDGRYDLGALRVDAHTASHSETIYEDRG